MGHWNDGYVSDAEYPTGFYGEQSPAYLNFAVALHGFEPVSLARPFTYFELGFGKGFTLNMLAASNPQGSFYGADFNPAQVVGARQMAEAAQLDNVTLLENSVQELADGTVDLPQFDFITMHGVYSWVNADNRRHIARFIARYLKPGGIVYVSYNALPGWSAGMSLQRLMLEYGRCHPNPSRVQLDGAVDLVQQLTDQKAAFFTGNPTLSQRLQALKTYDPQYLVHEYLNTGWQPLYHADVARDMVRAKLDYVGTAHIHKAFPHLYLTLEQQNLANSVADPVMRETIKDYMLNTPFREDLFIRGARRMTPHSQNEWMQSTGLALTVLREQARFNLTIDGRPTAIDKEPYALVFDELEREPLTLGQLAALPAIKDISTGALLEMAALLILTKQASPWSVSTAFQDVGPAHKINAMVALQSQFDDSNQTLASPLLGTGVGSGLMQRIVYLALSRGVDEREVDAISTHVWQIVRDQGRPLFRDGHILQAEDQCIAEVRATVEAILSRRLPVWRQLQMI